jgi:uncharacterized phage infection (PIP) family protein YhgE
MRTVSFVLVLLLVLVLGSACSTAPKRSTVHYSPPSVQPVRDKISSAQSSIVQAVTAAGTAKAAIARAEASLSAAPADKPDVANLHEDLAEASGAVNSLTTQLESARSSLADGAKSTDTLEQTIGTQTTDLNTCSDDKNKLLDQVRDLKAAAVLHDRKYHRLKIGVCTLAAAVASFLAVRLGLLKLLRMLSLLGPWGMAGAAAAAVSIPAGIFTLLWFKL